VRGDRPRAQAYALLPDSRAYAYGWNLSPDLTRQLIAGIFSKKGLDRFTHDVIMTLEVTMLSIVDELGCKKIVKNGGGCIAVHSNPTQYMSTHTGVLKDCIQLIPKGFDFSILGTWIINGAKHHFDAPGMGPLYPDTTEDDIYEILMEFV